MPHHFFGGAFLLLGSIPNFQNIIKTSLQLLLLPKLPQNHEYN